MTITIKEYKRCSVIKKVGRIDSFTSEKLLKAFESITEKDIYKIVFDMEEVDFISSRGFWVLIETQKNCKRYNRGELILANMPEKIRGSLDLVGLSQYFEMTDDVLSAVGSL